jgi:hypothetical protein
MKKVPASQVYQIIKKAPEKKEPHKKFKKNGH